MSIPSKRLARAATSHQLSNQLNSWLLRMVLLAALFVMFAPRTLGDDVKNPICEGCKKEITGPYMSVEGHAYHPNCFTCDSCGKPISGPFVPREGRHYHQECYQEGFGQRCAYCREVIEGKYISHEGKLYHEACYLNHVVDRCAYSGEPLVGHYMQDYWGNRVLSKYKSDVPVCFDCGRFIVQGKYYRIGAERIQCQSCERQSVNDPVEAHRVVQQARNLLERAGITLKIPDSEIRIELVSQERLQSISSPGGDSKGVHLVESRSFGGRVVSEKVTIYLLEKQPRDILYGVAAHELFHQWQHENGGKGGSNRQWIEGSANVASHLVLEQLDSDLARYQLHTLQKSKDPVYGDGYRDAIAYYQRHGLHRFLQRTSSNH